MRRGRSHANLQENFIAKLISKAFEFRAAAILHWMGHEDGRAIEANSASLRFKGVHKLLCQHAHSREIALIQRKEVVR